MAGKVGDLFKRDPPVHRQSQRKRVAPLFGRIVRHKNSADLIYVYRANGGIGIYKRCVGRCAPAFAVVCGVCAPDELFRLVTRQHQYPSVRQFHNSRLYRVVAAERSVRLVYYPSVFILY